jgi:hypothetical protein
MLYSQIAFSFHDRGGISRTMLLPLTYFANRAHCTLADEQEERAALKKRANIAEGRAAAAAAASSPEKKVSSFLGQAESHNICLKCYVSRVCLLIVLRVRVSAVGGSG